MTAADPLFGIHAQALHLQRQRMDLIAANIANADTPGYRARDLDFAAALNAAVQTPVKAGPGHLSMSGGAIGAAPSFERPGSQPSADGNTVDLQAEQARFAESALRYKASLSFIDGRLRGLLTAITGQ